MKRGFQSRRFGYVFAPTPMQPAHKRGGLRTGISVYATTRRLSGLVLVTDRGCNVGWARRLFTRQGGGGARRNIPSKEEREAGCNGRDLGAGRTAMDKTTGPHSRILRGREALALMALTAVSRPVVVDGDSFLDALFASAGQDRRAMEHRPQDRGSRRRTIDWQLDDRGALEARLGNVFNELQTCNSNLICSL